MNQGCIQRAQGRVSEAFDSHQFEEISLNQTDLVFGIDLIDFFRLLDTLESFGHSETGWTVSGDCYTFNTLADCQQVMENPWEV